MSEPNVDIPPDPQARLNKPAVRQVGRRTFWQTAMLSAAKFMPHPYECRGCGRSPLAITKIARPHTAMPRRVRLRWQRSPKAGGASKYQEPRLGPGISPSEPHSGFPRPRSGQPPFRRPHYSGGVLVGARIRLTASGAAKPAIREKV
jgi:hypothetical protein